MNDLPALVTSGATVILCVVLTVVAYLPALLLPPVEDDKVPAGRRLNAFFSSVALAFAAAQLLAGPGNLWGRLLLLLSAPFAVGLAGRRGTSVATYWGLWFLGFQHFLGHAPYLRGNDGISGAILYWSFAGTALMIVNFFTCLPARYVLYRRLERQHGRKGTFAAYVHQGLCKAATESGTSPFFTPLLFAIAGWFAQVMQGRQARETSTTAAALTDTQDTDAALPDDNAALRQGAVVVSPNAPSAVQVVGRK